MHGALEMAREARFALAVQPNPTLKVGDVAAFGDGVAVCRVGELHLTWYPQEGHCDLMIVGGGR